MEKKTTDLFCSPKLPEVELLFGRCDHILDRLRHSEFNHCLRFDLNGFPGLRVAPHTRLAGCLYQTTDAGNHEDAILPRFSYGDLCQMIQKLTRSFIT